MQVKPELKNKSCKRTTSQSIRDYENVRIRIAAAGNNLSVVTSHLHSIFGPHITAFSLLKQAKVLSERLSLSLDRLATRNRQALFCWFTENWEIVSKYLPVMADGPHYPNKQVIQARIDTPQVDEIDITDIRFLLNQH